MSLDVLAHELAWEEEAKTYNEDRIRVTIKEDGWYKFRVAAVTSDADGRTTRSRWDEHAQVLVLQKGNLGEFNNLKLAFLKIIQILFKIRRNPLSSNYKVLVCY